MFDDIQTQALTQALDTKRIKNRSKANVALSYLEGFDVIDTANKVFGFGNWSYSVSTLEQVSQESNTNQNVVICYKAVVRLTIYDQTHTKHISREDVGFGTGVAKTLADAYESAAKEAVTDAIKRCFRSFGNQFGNSLYDKSRNNTPQESQPQAPKQYQRATASTDPFASLRNLGLAVIDQGDVYVVAGEDVYSKKDSIKACGFKFDASSKRWWKPKEQQAA
ncbi:MAG: DNA repair protein Rad52 [Sulfurovum sp. PC08-66]|nr:MAG: DNA repair protein Rad52 [Sulfurovum sp. PC08-66]